MATGAHEGKRGSSEDYPKHNFTLELSLKHSLGGLKKEDDWILCASYIDRSFMRHKLSFDLFRSFRQENIAPQSTYIEVYRNFRYHGLYVLMERMDAKRLKVSRGDSAAMIFKEPSIFVHPSIPTIGSNPYIAGDLHHQKFPKLNHIDLTTKMETLRNFIAFAPDSVFFHPENGVASIFDMKSIIDWHILLQVTHNNDGVIKNFYLYRQNTETGFRIAPWDYDHSFGRDGDSEPHLPGPIDVSKNTLLNRLLQNSTYRNELRQRYFELVQNEILTVDNLQRMVQTLSNEVKIHAQKDEARWGHDPIYFDQVDFVKEIQLIQSWVPRHLELLHAYFTALR